VVVEVDAFVGVGTFVGVGILVGVGIFTGVGVLVGVGTFVGVGESACVGLGVGEGVEQDVPSAFRLSRVGALNVIQVSVPSGARPKDMLAPGLLSYA
jgi:hypothetical protein